MAIELVGIESLLNDLKQKINYVELRSLKNLVQNIQYKVKIMMTGRENIKTNTAIEQI